MGKLSGLRLWWIEGNRWNQLVHELESNQNDPGVRCFVSQDYVKHISWNTAHIIHIMYTTFGEAEEHKTRKQLWPSLSLVGHEKKWVLNEDKKNNEKSSTGDKNGINHYNPYVKQNMLQSY